jgi:hypothetical protein
MWKKITNYLKELILNNIALFVIAIVCVISIIWVYFFVFFLNVIHRF